MPIILVIVGITGDLAKRKLLPAVEALAKAGVLPGQFKIIGTTRQSGVSADKILGDSDLAFVREHLEFCTMDPAQAEQYARLSNRLQEVEQEFGTPAERLFYVSVPPKASQTIIEMLGHSALAKVPHTKLLIEKPFGTDYASAAMLIEHINQYFEPDQVYRIDHYLAKAIAQNLISSREQEPHSNTWNKEHIERIEIIAAESLGVEGRGDFYEQTGALRDVVQSHLLELAALALMKSGRKNMPARRLAALRQLNVVQGAARRGQYRGYPDEVKNPESVVETYARVTLESSDPQFAGVPITLVTGKQLGVKRTEIRIIFRAGTHGAKDLVLAEQQGTPDAYEKVLRDAIRSDRTFFVSSEEVLESWRILAPVQEAWSKFSADLQIYEKGSEPLYKEVKR